MKGFGIFLVVIGLICEIIAMKMNVSVWSGYGYYDSPGLMKDRSILVTAGGIAFILGMILKNFIIIFSMKSSGILLVVIGLICEIIAMTMDVSVLSGYSGDRVNNLGLMNDRSNLVMGGGIAFISGIILIGFSSKSITSKNGKQCPQCAEMIKQEAKICRFCQKEQPKTKTNTIDLSEIKTIGELQKEIVTLRKQRFSHSDIATGYNKERVPLPEEYAYENKWSPSLVKQIENG